jgi:hypothetical protein
MESEREILEYARSGKLQFPPLHFDVVGESIPRDWLRADLLLEGSWQDKKQLFVAEVKRYSSDKNVSDAADQATKNAQVIGGLPLVITPWFSREQLLELERRGVSGLDLCGNGIVIVPGEMLVLKTGQPNKFPASRLIRRVYEGTSSLVARVFLLQPYYERVSDIVDEIKARRGSITISTVSKALKQLEQDMVVKRAGHQIKLLQAEKLLDRLAANHRKPAVQPPLRCKVTTPKKGPIEIILADAAERAKERVVLTGESSVNYYASLAVDPVVSFYCSNFEKLDLQKYGCQIDFSSRFPNVEIYKTDAEEVYFDARKIDRSWVSSPVQTYCELATSDKRGIEAAQDVARTIISDLKSKDWIPLHE